MSKKKPGINIVTLYGCFDDIGIYLSRDRKPVHTFACNVGFDGRTLDQINNIGINAIKKTDPARDITGAGKVLNYFEEQTSFDPATFGQPGEEIQTGTKDERGDEMINWKSHDKERAGKSFSKRPFLNKKTAKDVISEDGTEATITDVRELDGAFSDVGVDVKIGKKEYTWGLNFGSVGLDQLREALGANDAKWKGKKITLKLAKGKYVNVDV